LGVAGGILAVIAAPGSIGAGASGQPTPPMERPVISAVVLLGCPVDSRLGLEPEIGVYNSLPENPRPNHNNQESVA